MFIELEESLIMDKSIYPATLRVIAYMKTKPLDFEFKVTEIRNSFGLSENKWRKVSQQLRQLGIATLIMSPKGCRLKYLGIENYLKFINQQKSI